MPLCGLMLPQLALASSCSKSPKENMLETLEDIQCVCGSKIVTLNGALVNGAN